MFVKNFVKDFKQELKEAREESIIESEKIHFLMDCSWLYL